MAGKTSGILHIPGIRVNELRTRRTIGSRPKLKRFARTSRSEVLFRFAHLPPFQLKKEGMGLKYYSAASTLNAANFVNGYTPIRGKEMARIVPIGQKYAPE